MFVPVGSPHVGGHICSAAEGSQATASKHCLNIITISEGSAHKASLGAHLFSHQVVLLSGCLCVRVLSLQPRV